VTRARENDSVTRGRLLSAATRLFAAHGFKRVTVRDICREAEANVAAVNYHFGDKLGLYREVLLAAIQTMRGTTEAAREAGREGSAEERLRAYIQVFLERVIVGRAHDSWIHQLMLREMADPTPAIDMVTDQVIRPRLEYLATIVAELLHRDPDDEVVRRCVLSVHSQFLVAMPNSIAKRLLPDVRDPHVLSQWASHIVRFSIEGIRGVGRAPA
jgi:AcrR family transcriptional regulator